MWTLRRASLHLRSQRLNVEASRTSCVRVVLAPRVENDACFRESNQLTSNRYLSTNTLSHTDYGSVKFTPSWRELSSQADASGTKEDYDLEDELSNVETCGSNNDESEKDLSDGDEDGEKQHDGLGLSDTEIGSAKKKTQGLKRQSELFKAILDVSGVSVRSALDNWVEQGKELTRDEITLAVTNLRSCKMYSRALQLYEWLQSTKKLEFIEKDYASQLDLIAKSQGLEKAEEYIERVPESFRGELLYRTLLANAVFWNDLKEMEKIFNKMRDLGLPITTFACNQLLLMYKKVDKKKIADVLLLMEKENLEPSLVTYKILIDVKGQSNDVDGMEQVVETMKAEGIEPDYKTLVVLAKHYISAGLKKKAEAILKEIEGENLEKKRWVCASLLELYADMRKAEEVKRIWNVCKSGARLGDYQAAIQAWGKLNNVEAAEAVFKKMLKKYRPSFVNCTDLLVIYADHKMLKKGVDLIKRISNSGGRIGPLALNAIVKLYVQAGEVEKAETALNKAFEPKKFKPMFSTYMVILEAYAKKGDIHNSEKIFLRMTQAGYTSRQSRFQVLVQAYINAKAPAYGIKERMKADKVFPNKGLANQLLAIDPFRETLVSKLLD